MEEVKSNRGGRRKGAGRKPKADEERIRTLAINAMVKVFGSEEGALKSCAEQAKLSFPHMKLLFEYGYGKPKEKVEIESGTASIPIINFITNVKEDDD